MRTSPITDELAADAYVYAYSMDEAYRFLYETTIKPGIPFNEFQMIRDLADDTYTAHPTINNDTLHLQGWFDVAVEPVVVTVPDFDEGRYWILHTMDLGHYTTAMIGSRTAARRAADSSSRPAPGTEQCRTGSTRSFDRTPTSSRSWHGS